MNAPAEVNDPHVIRLFEESDALQYQSKCLIEEGLAQRDTIYALLIRSAELACQSERLRREIEKNSTGNRSL